MIEDKAVRPKDYTTPGSYLRAYMQRIVRENKEDSFGAEVHN